MAEQISKAIAAANTLNLSLAELQKVRLRLAELDDREGGSTRRTFARWPLEGLSLIVRVTHAAGGEATLRLAPRNISAGGISVLHSAYLYPGTKCHVMLPDTNQVHTVLPGWVARCIHRYGPIHEVGIRFNEPIEIRKYVASAGGGAPHTLHAVNPANLRGKVILIDPSDFWTGQIRRELGETCIELVCTAQAHEGVKLAQQGAAVVLISAEVADMRPFEAISLMRAAGVECPVVMLCPPGSGVRAGQVPLQGISVLPRPSPPDALLFELSEHLLVEAPERPKATKECLLGLDDDVRADLIRQMERILAAAASGDVMRAHGLALKLRGAAPAVGLKDLALAADTVVEALGQTMSVEESADALHKLKEILGVMRSDVRKAA